MALRAPTGTTDLLPEQAHAWNSIRTVALATFGLYGYQPIETPVFEQLEVFVRGIGDATDVVGKEMFLTFSQHAVEKIASGEKPSLADTLALRPEQTAGVARAIAQHNLVPPEAATLKLVYAGSMFRHERPQKGRLREFHQIGAECIGSAEPSADAEVIIMLMRFFESLGIPQDAMRLLINSMGDDDCRPAYREQVRAYILAHTTELCDECVRRADTNPLRSFDCKNPKCQEIMTDAPAITDALCPSCAAHYTTVKSLLDDAAITYVEQPCLVRGLDYYTRTVFEVQVVDGLGAQNAIGGGGRYDKLIAEFGGKPTPGLGFAVGFERIVLALQAAGAEGYALPHPQVYIAAVDASTRAMAFSLANRLRDVGIATELDHQSRSLKSQFKQAGRSGALFVVIVGPDEMARGVVTLRNMQSSEEQTVPLDDLVEKVSTTI
ncbi:MAG: histidine--tRNA ligase [Coriobacteriales bacterium]|jgi:histidyl-tRNA synthetase|nr:histidine--tRNA ligase [Coriobacteriales bacterium]